MKINFVFLIIGIVWGMLSCKKDKIELNASWTRVTVPTSPVNPYVIYTDISFDDSGVGLICGDYGEVLKSTDDGVTWQLLNSGTSFSLSTAFVLNTDELMLGGIGFHKSTNGMSFSELGNLSSSLPRIMDVHFFDSNQGILASGGKLYESNDGGVSWDLNFDSNGGYASKILFVDNQFGFFTGGRTWDGVSVGELHMTQDGGQNWNSLDVSSHSEITAIYFLNDQLGWFVNYNREIYKTKDSGLSWLKESNSSEEIFFDVLFLDESTGYAIINGGSIYKTTDGGASWNLNFEDANETFSALTKNSKNEIFAIGNDRLLLKRN